MVLRPNEVALDRSEVMRWVKSWKRMSKSKRPPIEDYIRAKVEATLDDPMVQKAHFSEDPVMVHAADVIISDLESYGVGTSS